MFSNSKNLLYFQNWVKFSNCVVGWTDCDKYVIFLLFLIPSTTISCLNITLFETIFGFTFKNCRISSTYHHPHMFRNHIRPEVHPPKYPHIWPLKLHSVECRSGLSSHSSIRHDRSSGHVSQHQAHVVGHFAIDPQTMTHCKWKKKKQNK